MVELFCMYDVWNKPVLDIDGVPEVVIWKVNWLYYLNYEAITHISSTCH